MPGVWALGDSLSRVDSMIYLVHARRSRDLKQWNYKDLGRACPTPLHSWVEGLGSMWPSSV